MTPLERARRALVHRLNWGLGITDIDEYFDEHPPTSAGDNALIDDLIRAVPSSSQQEIAAVKKEEKNDQEQAEPCAWCDGTGVDVDAKCERCDGSGRLGGHLNPADYARACELTPTGYTVTAWMEEMVDQHTTMTAAMRELLAELKRCHEEGAEFDFLSTLVDRAYDTVGVIRVSAADLGFIEEARQTDSGTKVAGEASTDSAQERSAQVMDAPRDPLSGDD